MERHVIDFGDPWELDRWEIINDTVMGGVSSGRLSITENGSALFQGEVSLENYGGFTSMRTLPREFGLDGASGLKVRFRGDGKNYRLRLRTDDAWEGIAWQAYFQTERHRWMTASLPFGAFVPVFRGNVIKEAPDLDVSRVKRVGFMIADEQDGPFRLEIEWVRAYA